jgi:hypothetical protein
MPDEIRIVDVKPRYLLGDDARRYFWRRTRRRSTPLLNMPVACCGAPLDVALTEIVGSVLDQRQQALEERPSATRATEAIEQSVWALHGSALHGSA